MPTKEVLAATVTGSTPVSNQVIVIVVAAAFAAIAWKAKYRVVAIIAAVIAVAFLADTVLGHHLAAGLNGLLKG